MNGLGERRFLTAGLGTERRGDQETERRGNVLAVENRRSLKGASGGFFGGGAGFAGGEEFGEFGARFGGAVEAG